MAGDAAQRASASSNGGVAYHALGRLAGFTAAQESYPACSAGQPGHASIVIVRYRFWITESIAPGGGFMTHATDRQRLRGLRPCALFAVIAVAAGLSSCGGYGNCDQCANYTPFEVSYGLVAAN